MKTRSLSRWTLLAAIAVPAILGLVGEREEAVPSSGCDLHGIARAILADTTRLTQSIVREDREYGLEGSRARILREGSRVRRIVLEDMGETGARRLDAYAADSSNLLLVQVVSKYRKPVSEGGSSADANQTIRITLVCGGRALEAIPADPARSLSDRVRSLLRRG